MRRLITAVLAVVALAVPFAASASAIEPHGLARNPDCTLRVPDHPLSAQGLATPYVLSSAGTTCSEADPGTAAFVQATILDPVSGSVKVYAPAVKDAGQPLAGAAPPLPVLPHGAVVTVWTGFNGGTLKLTGPGRREFANFQQQAYAGSPKFFRALNNAIAHGLVTVPGLGMANDGQPCPSSRDFSIVDQDPSDNNPQSYPAYGVGNASDEKTVATVDHALGCTPWLVPSLDPEITGGMVSTSGPLLEAQAAAHQQFPVATIPGGDPFAQRKPGVTNFFLLNLLRSQVDQPLTMQDGTQEYCLNLFAHGEPRLKLDASTESMFPNTTALGNNLANQLANRFVQAWQILGCKGLTGMDSPIQVTLDGNGVAIAATYA